MHECVQRDWPVVYNSRVKSFRWKCIMDMDNKISAEAEKGGPQISRMIGSGKVSIRRILGNALLFAAVLGLTAFVVFRQVTPEEILKALESLSPPFIVGGLAAMGVYMVMESLNIRRVTAVTGIKLRFHKAFKYAVLGFFFSSVTPASTGGKPMQILFMYRDGHSVSKSTLSLIFEVMNYELVMAVYAVLGYITQRRLLVMALGKIRFALLFGISVNVLVTVLLILSIFSRGTIEFFSRLAARIVGAFARDKADAAAAKVKSIAAEYQECSVYIKGNKPVMVKTFLTACVQLFAMFSVPYFVYVGFGLGDYNILQVVMLEAVAYVSLAFLPVPGAIGASEGVLVMIFRILFPQSLVATAMLLSRSLMYYLIVIASGAAVLFFMRISAARRRRAEREAIDKEQLDNMPYDIGSGR